MSLLRATLSLVMCPMYAGAAAALFVLAPPSRVAAAIVGAILCALLALLNLIDSAIEIRAAFNAKEAEQ